MSQLKNVGYEAVSIYLFMPVLGITFQFIKTPNVLFSRRYHLICFLIGYTILIQELLLANYGIGMVNYGNSSY
jgi:hypothetical protein